MIDFTLNQWAILALVLVLGWLLGLLSRPSNIRWKRAAADERVARQDAESRLAAAQARIGELERNAYPTHPGTAAAVGAAAAGHRDDLSLIHGIGRERETRLNEGGIHGYRDVETMSDGDAAATESRLGLASGTIAREEWREQARVLRDDGAGAHAGRWPR